MDDVTVDLGPISFHDALVLQWALKNAIDLGYFWTPGNYAALVAVKAQLNVRIAKAEKTAQYVEPA